MEAGRGTRQAGEAVGFIPQGVNNVQIRVPGRGENRALTDVSDRPFGP